MLPRPERGNPYLPAGVPRDPRHSKAIARWSSGPYNTVSVIGVPFRSALLSKLDNDAVVELSVRFRDHWTETCILGPHEALSVKSIQGVLGILSRKRSTLVQSVARNNGAAYAGVFKLNKPKA